MTKRERRRRRRAKKKFIIIDRCPVPRGRMADAVQAIKDNADKHGEDCGLNSCYRGDKATSILRRLGKSTQRMLYYGWIRYGYPRFNPANPPGISTHELFSDGVAYRGPKGRALLSPWKCGMDWYNVAAADRAAKRLGYDMRRPYAADSEAHHRNFYRRPKKR